MKIEKKIFQWLRLISPLLLCLCTSVEIGKAKKSSTKDKYVGTIFNDTVWEDTNGNEIWCNGGNMLREENTFYWVGYETKPRIGFRNIKLYSSINLADWKFENNIIRREGPLSILGWAGRPALLHNRRTS